MNAYYLRNEQEDAQGRSAKDTFKENWRELIEKGEDAHRGYVPGDRLVLVNTKANFFAPDSDPFQVAEHMFAFYNRGSGECEEQFDGPSLSVGDLVAIQMYKLDVMTVKVFLCASVGFKEIPTCPEIEAVLPQSKLFSVDK